MNVNIKDLTIAPKSNIPPNIPPNIQPPPNERTISEWLGKRSGQLASGFVSRGARGLWNTGKYVGSSALKFGSGLGSGIYSGSKHLTK